MKSIKGKIAAVLTAASIGLTALPVTSFAETAFMRDSVTIEYNAKVSKPTYMIKGTPGKRKIKLSCSTAGATIYYTTDGSTPTTSDKKYTGLITIKKNTKIKAIAVVGGSKSSVMSKTVKVSTLLGDVTGNGTVDEADYTRFKNYRAGKTTYVCKDNCDMNGSGGISSSDLKLLRAYLDEDSEEDAEEVEVDTSIDKPTLTIYKAYGGYKFKAETDTKNAVLYYTTNGTTPDKNDNKYTGMVTVTKDCTINVVAYKDGSYSAVKSRSVTLGSCSEPYSDKATDQEYQDSVKVTLKCDKSGSRILYTTNGSDPVEYGKVYNGPIELTEDTTLKVVAQAKGCKDSNVVTYNYKVKSSMYTISGHVWDDTSYGAADGKYQSGETGVNGITVHLLNTSTNKYEFSMLTETINGIAGSYSFTKAKPGVSYKVVFQFNGQKYRPYSAVVAGGNQAIITAEIPALIIKNTGAYSVADKLLVAANSYTNAIISTYFNSTYATTTSSYSSAADNVNLALRSDIYGMTGLNFVSNKVTSVETGKTTDAVADQKVFAGDVLANTLRVTNKSTTQILKSAGIMVYLDANVEIQSIKNADGTIAVYAYQGTNTNLGKTKYLITCPEIAPGKAIDFVITGKVVKGVKNGKAITSFAEIYTYSYAESCYDKNSIPGNFTGSVREADEAATVRVAGYESLTDSQTIAWASGNDTSPILVNTSRVLKFNIKNGIDISDYSIYVSDPAVITYSTYCTSINGGTECVIIVTGKRVGTTNIVISLKRDATKLIDTTLTVTDVLA